MTYSFAFSGAFFAWPYQAGVAAYVQEHELLDARSRIYGSSSGAVVGAFLACGVDMATDGLSAGLESNTLAMGGRKHPFFHPGGVIPIYFDVVGGVLPPDAYKRASGRLFVSVTKVPRMKRTLISEFASNAALLDALGASIAIPGVTVRFAHKTTTHGWCIDGGPVAYHDMRPGVETIRVGVRWHLPFTRPDHIEPSRHVSFADRFLIPPEEQRRDLYALGYTDARAYLEKPA